MFLTVKQNRLLLLILAFLAFTSATKAQNIRLNSYFDTTSILIGDQLKYTIEVLQPQKMKVKFPVFKDSLSSKIEILKPFPADTTKKDNNWLIRKSYLVTSFDSGTHVVPPQPFILSGDQRNDTLKSNAVFLKVNTLPVDTAKEIMDIKPVMNTPFSIMEIIWELLIGLGILVFLALLIWIFLRIRKKKPLFASVKPKEPAHIIALRDLNALQNEKLWQSGRIKEYYTRITDILRVYLFNRFEINALEMTSDEILEAMNPELNMDNELKATFTKLLQLADLVKFAKAEPLPDEHEISMLSAYMLVNRTKMEVIQPVSSSTEEGELTKK